MYYNSFKVDGTDHGTPMIWVQILQNYEWNEYV